MLKLGILKWGTVALLVALACVAAWGAWERHWHHYWKERAYVIKVNLDSVVGEVGAQSNNPKLHVVDDNVEPVLDQVQALGRAKREWQDVATVQSTRIADLGREQERLERMLASERRKAERLIAQRNSALQRLQNQEMTPQERSTCETQLQAVEVALDTLFEEGF